MKHLNNRLTRIAKEIPPGTCPHCGLAYGDKPGPSWQELLPLATDAELDELGRAAELADELRNRYAVKKKR